MIFPVISLLSGIASLLDRWRHKKHSSPVFVPLVGPILLTIWVILAGKPFWFIAVVWVADIGTLAFFAVSPKLLIDYWRTSPFTKILTLTGSRENQTATVTLHSTGYYLLKKSWKRRTGEAGIVELAEPGTFTQTGDCYELISYTGLHRILRKRGTDAFLVEEEASENEGFRNYSLNQWMLRNDQKITG